MKKIEAFIRPDKLPDLKDMLVNLDLNGLSISQIMGCGNQKGWHEYVRGTETEYTFRQKLKLEIVVPDAKTEDVINAISTIAYTGEVGDGKIFYLEDS